MSRSINNLGPNGATAIAVPLASSTSLKSLTFLCAQYDPSHLQREGAGRVWARKLGDNKFILKGNERSKESCGLCDRWKLLDGIGE